MALTVLLALLLPLTATAEPTPDDAVAEAKTAAENAEFGQLRPLLDSVVDDQDEPAPKVHLLLALGLTWEARAEDDDELESKADSHIEKAFDADPHIELDPLVYPPQFVARVEAARPDADPADVADTEIFYFEREVTRHSRLPLYLPGGIGQFYNDMPFRGATFAAVQLLGVATNVVAHWTIESMRTSGGHISADDADRARGWRRAQYAGLATFFAGWALGVVEAHLSFEPETVRIRHLDEPPDELEHLSGADAGAGPIPVVEWTLRF